MSKQDLTTQPNLLDVRQYPFSPRVETCYWRIIWDQLYWYCYYNVTLLLLNITL